MADKKVYIGTGRRKSSIAQVRMVSGKGKITVNVEMLEISSHMKLM